jgi:hypothetical protein
MRQACPSMKIISRAGFEDVAEAVVRAQCEAVLTARRQER